MLTADRNTTECAVNGERVGAREVNHGSKPPSLGRTTTIETESLPDVPSTREIHFEYRDLEVRWGGLMLNGGTRLGPEDRREGRTRFSYERCRATRGGFQVNGLIDSASFARMEHGARFACHQDPFGGGSAGEDCTAIDALPDLLSYQRENVRR